LQRDAPSLDTTTASVAEAEVFGTKADGAADDPPEQPATTVAASAAPRIADRDFIVFLLRSAPESPSGFARECRARIIKL